MTKIAVIGLGKLGACMAAVFADAGHHIVGFDTNLETLIGLRAGIAPVDEPGLQELITANRGSITVADTVADAVRDTELAFIIVPTPSRPDGTFDDNIVVDTLHAIGAAVKDHQRHDYMVVVSSTVSPGACNNVLQPALDTAARRHVPLCYSPEFIALGTVIKDMRRPDVVLIGADDGDAALRLVEVLDEVVHTNAEFVYLNRINAELAKISVNSYVTMKISFANQLAAICENIRDADALLVLNAISHDRRIGASYLNPGGPYGGPCFPRDNRAFQAVATRAGTYAPLAAASDVINDDVLDRITALLPVDADLAILGMSYKPGTSVTEESLGTKLLKRFPQAETHDPSTSAEHPQDVVARNAHIVVATAWPDYCYLNYSINHLVVDVWGFLPDGRTITRLGVG